MPPIAHTTLGAVVGRQLGNGVAEYLGMQYATAERWSAPIDRTVPYNTLGNFRADDGFGPNCPQLAGQVYNESFADEDCLFIQGCWAPPPASSRPAPVPVLVWIHGGGLAYGGGSAFNGSVLSAAHGALVCTINYRLGWLGWLAFPEDANRTTGNWGLLDQQSALRWIRANAAAFGGDREAVAIFGQSAGASSVLRHLVSPGSRGLFRRAIAESGTLHAWSRDFALSKAALAAAALSCPRSPSRRCMSGKGVAEILAAQGPAPTPGISDEQVLAVVDGATLPADPLELLRAGRYPPGASLLLGGNTLDASLFTYGYDDFANMSAAAYTRSLNASLHVDGRSGGRRLEEVLKLYPSTADASSNQRSYALFATDEGFLCPARAAAEAAASAGLPTFLYHFDHAWPDPRCWDLYFAPEFSVTHTAEISYVFMMPTYVFGRPQHPERCHLNRSEASFASFLGGLWTRFALSGVPDPEWPQYGVVGRDQRGNNDSAVVLKEPGDLADIELAWRKAECLGWAP
jgi:para-nitrobenzyl esterase